MGAIITQSVFAFKKIQQVFVKEPNTVEGELRSKDTVDASMGLPRQRAPSHEGQSEQRAMFLG